MLFIGTQFSILYTSMYSPAASADDAASADGAAADGAASADAAAFCTG